MIDPSPRNYGEMFFAPRTCSRFSLRLEKWQRWGNIQRSNGAAGLDVASIFSHDFGVGRYLVRRFTPLVSWCLFSGFRLRWYSCWRRDLVSSCLTKTMLCCDFERPVLLKDRDHDTLRFHWWSNYEFGALLPCRWSYVFVFIHIHAHTHIYIYIHTFTFLNLLMQ